MLEKERMQIDQIDRQLVQLLEERWAVVDQIQAIKKREKLTVLDSSREQKVLEKVAQLVQTPAYKESIQAVFQAMMDRSKEYQHQK